MNQDIRQIVFARAGGRCECMCGESLGDVGQLDHFFGRAKVPEAVENCWALLPRCHDAKTNNRPSAAFWAEKFIIHAGKYDYENEARRAWTKLAVLHAKGFA